MSDTIESENPVTVLTQGIARLLDINCPRHKVDKYIKHLQSMCFGSTEDKFSKYFGFRLTQDECVDCLLSVSDIQDYCLSNPREGLKIADQLLSFNKLSGIASQFLASVLPNLVNCMSIQELHPTLESLWKVKDKTNFPLPLLECMMLEKRQVESALIKAYLEAEDCVRWEDFSFRNWIQWGSCSPFIFQTITTVLNNILVHSNNRCVAFRMIKDYINSLKKHCAVENRDFVKLYPLEYQNLVFVLKLEVDPLQSDSSFGDFQKFVINSLQPVFMSNPHVGLMLLSHFHQWIPIFSTNMNVSTL